MVRPLSPTLGKDGTHLRHEGLRQVNVSFPASSGVIVMIATAGGCGCGEYTYTTVRPGVPSRGSSRVRYTTMGPLPCTGPDAELGVVFQLSPQFFDRLPRNGTEYLEAFRCRGGDHGDGTAHTRPPFLISAMRSSPS